MLICVLSLAIPGVLGLLWLIFKIGDICYDKAYDKYHHLRWEDYKKENDPELEIARKNLDKLNWTRNDCREIFGTGSLVSLILPFFAFLILLCMRSPYVDEKDYLKFQHSKEVLEYRLESGIEVGNELLYNDIVEFNNKLTEHKLGRENIWVSWYFNPKIAEISYIDYKNIKDKDETPKVIPDIDL